MECNNCKFGLHEACGKNDCSCACNPSQLLANVAKTGSVQEMHYKVMAETLVSKLTKTESLALRVLLRMDVDSYLYNALIEELQNKGVLRR